MVQKKIWTTNIFKREKKMNQWNGKLIYKKGEYFDTSNVDFFCTNCYVNSDSLISRCNLASMKSFAYLPR